MLRFDISSKFYEIFKEDTMPPLCKLFQKTEKNETPYVILWGLSNLDTKAQYEQYMKENHKPILFLNISSTILKKILTGQHQQYIFKNTSCPTLAYLRVLV